MNQKLKTEYLLALWEMWIDKIIKDYEKGNDLETLKEEFQLYYKNHGIVSPTKQDPLTLMFCSFVGGVEIALNLTTEVA